MTPLSVAEGLISTIIPDFPPLFTDIILALGDYVNKAGMSAINVNYTLTL